MVKKWTAALLCLCLIGLCAVGCGSAPQQEPLNGDDPEATVNMPAPTDTPTPSPAGARGDYATRTAPVPFGELGTFDGVAWQIDGAPYVFDLTVSDVKQGQAAKDALSEGSMELPKLASGEEYFLARVKVNLTRCQDSDATVDFSTLGFSFVQDDGSTVFQTPLMTAGDDPTLTQFREGGYIETTLVGKAKAGTQPALVFQPSWGDGFWMATH